MALIQKHFIAATVDDSHYRRQRDAEGNFFRQVSDQSAWYRARPQPPDGDPVGPSRQGLYTLTASGKLFDMINNGHDPSKVRKLIQDALQAWKALPETERAPGAVKVEEPSHPVSSVVYPTLPEDGLALRVYMRYLDKDEAGKLHRLSARKNLEPHHFSNQDRLWLTKAECKALVPKEPRKGHAFAVPEEIAVRLLRFHLADITPANPLAGTWWSREEIRRKDFKVSVEEATASRVVMKLSGSALLASDADTSKAERGYDAHLLGFLEYDIAKNAFQRFDVLALGDFWGGPYESPGRPGRSTIGIAFELPVKASDLNRVPPYASRFHDDYLSRP